VVLWGLHHEFITATQHQGISRLLVRATIKTTALLGVLEANEFIIARSLASMMVTGWALITALSQLPGSGQIIMSRRS